LAWQAWRLWHWAGSGGALGPVLVAGDAAALCVASVALGDIHLRFVWQVWHLVTSTFVLAWQAWHLWHWAGSGGALGPVLVAGDAAALCVAGVALGDINLRFAWQAWHLWHWAGPGVTHHLSHTPLSHTIFHTPSLTHPLSQDSFAHHLCHTPSFTHRFVTHHL